MGIPSDLRDSCTKIVTRRRGSVSPPPLLVASPLESPPPISSSTRTPVQEAIVSGFANAAIAGVVASGPVIIGCRSIPWAKANLNYVAQAFLISSASIASFFITADKIILEGAKKNSFSKVKRTP